MIPQRDHVHWYAGQTTFYRAPERRPEDLPAGSVGVLGVPLDSWTLGRNGQRYAPRAIREMSLYLAGYYGLQPEDVGYVNVTNGRVQKLPAEPRLFDCGDVELIQGDVHEQIEAIADPVAAITRAGAFPVVLGGDHFTPYPSYVGFVRALRERKPDAKVGFLNLDGHFDIWDEFRGVGRWNHGTFARRLAEHEAIGRMVWWGLNGANILEPDQLRLCHERGFVGYTTESIRRRGVEETIREALELAAEGADAVYVTFDIDVTDGAQAPGTHSIVIDGLDTAQVLEALSIIGKTEIVGAFDVSEMLPQYDVGGGRTARYAAQAILTVIEDRIYETEQVFERDVLDAVFR